MARSAERGAGLPARARPRRSRLVQGAGGVRLRPASKAPPPLAPRAQGRGRWTRWDRWAAAARRSGSLRCLPRGCATKTTRCGSRGELGGPATKTHGRARWAPELDEFVPFPKLRTEELEFRVGAAQPNPSEVRAALQGGVPNIATQGLRVATALAKTLPDINHHRQLFQTVALRPAKERRTLIDGYRKAEQDRSGRPRNR